MRNLFLFLVAACVVVAILPNNAHGKSVKRLFKTGRRSTDDEPVTVIPLIELLESYDIHSTNAKRQTLPGMPDGTVIAYLVFATCEYVAFWAMEFSGKFVDAWMNLRYYTDPLNPPDTWVTVNKNLMFSFAGSVTFTVTLGPYDPCTTVYIETILERPDGLTKMGNITIETDCPCDPGTGQGDPHYVTFDKYHLEFNGKCSYVLAETCKDSPYYLKVISKHGEVVNTLSNPDARRIESADITTNNHKINLADDGQITIDGIVVNSYYLSDEGEIGIQMIDNITSIVFSDKGKWWVEWTKNIRNKRNILYIGIHKDSDLIGKMCGMLGPKLPSNAPSQSFIGYQMKNGKYTYDVIELGNSYVVPNSCP